MKYGIADGKLHGFPPKGGWKYREVATGWEAPHPLQNDFATTVKQIGAHREANPQYKLETSQAACARALEQQTAERIVSEVPSSIKEWVVPLDEEAKKKLNTRVQSLRRKVAGVVSAVNAAAKMADGAATVIEWLGGHDPVSKGVAEHRASICLDCKSHKEGDWQTTVLARLGGKLRDIKAYKDGHSLNLSSDSKLGTCTACDCPAALKVWMDKRFILENTDIETYNSLPNNCWIK